MDLFSRHILSWKLSNSLDAEFCLDALEMALGDGRKPEVFHSDQGWHFTSSAFVARLQAETIKISWSGRKRCYDNILVERLWRTVKDEQVYPRACAMAGRLRSAPGPISLEVLPCSAAQLAPWEAELPRRSTLGSNHVPPAQG